MSCDELLIRLPLAGVSLHSYDEKVRGHLCKGANIFLRISILVVGILFIAQVFPTAYASLTLIPMAGAAFLFFAAGSNTKRRFLEIVAEFAIASVCVTLVILAQMGTLTFMHAGIGIIATLGGGILIGIPAEKGKIEQLPTRNLKELPLLLKIIDSLVGMARDGAVSAISMLSSITHRKNYSSTIADEADQPLCVFIHGLASRPAVFDPYYDALKGKNITLFQPYVEKNGRCSLETTAESIKKSMEAWMKKYPSQKIIFIGVSNGARNAGKISSDLKKAGMKNPMQVHCIAGPFEGTTFVNRPDWPSPLRKVWSPVFKKMYSEEVFEELSWQSSYASTVIEGMQQAAQKGVEYHFYATAADMIVTPFPSALPDVANARYFSASAEGHQGILCAVQETIIQATTDFISRECQSEPDEIA